MRVDDVGWRRVTIGGKAARSAQRPRGRPWTKANPRSADPRQQLADRHVEDAARAEDGAEGDAIGVSGDDLLPDSRKPLFMQARDGRRAVGSIAQPPDRSRHSYTWCASAPRTPPPGTASPPLAGPGGPTTLWSSITALPTTRRGRTAWSGQCPVHSTRDRGPQSPTGYAGRRSSTLPRCHASSPPTPAFGRSE